MANQIIDDTAEGTIEGFGVKSSAKVPGRYVQPFVMGAGVAVAILAASMLKAHDEDSKMLSLRMVNSVNRLTESIKMQTCLSTLPLEKRQTEYSNPNSGCRFLSKERD